MQCFFFIRKGLRKVSVKKAAWLEWHLTLCCDVILVAGVTKKLIGHPVLCVVEHILNTAGHRHRGRSRRHRHSGILYLSPVPDWVPLFRYRTGSGIRIFVHSGTGLTGQSDIPAFQKAVVGGGERETQCTSKLQVAESDTPFTSIDSCWWCYSCYIILKNLVNAGMPEKS